ncbi:MAG: amidohydrolase family protein [Acetobacteraceae bacterium]|nr:amidohydrolase family protein [Acetobacteraceae bacterium]
MFDHVISGARLPSGGDPVDIGFAAGRIAAIEPSLAWNGPADNAGGKLVCAGLIETHIHLDKSGIMGRCTCTEGTLKEAVEQVKAAKQGFTEQDVYDRARRTLERAILHGTNRMRTHVEVDPRIGLTSVRAMQQLKRDYAWAIDLQLCAFPQEGLLDDPGCEAVLVEALEAGCDLVGGAPYVDIDSHGQIDRIFALARRFDLDIDFHLDFDLDASGADANYVCRQTDEAGWGGRVTIGHVTKLSAMPPQQFEAMARRLAAAGVAVTTLPATDLFLMGGDATENVPRGVAPVHRLLAHGVQCSISTNNVLNPFTPYGDGSLLRIANLFANVAQIAADEGLAACFEMITERSAGLMRLHDYGIRVGGPADLVLLDAETPAQAIAELAPALTGFKRGHRTFERKRPVLFPPLNPASTR